MTQRRRPVGTARPRAASPARRRGMNSRADENRSSRPRRRARSCAASGRRPPAAKWLRSARAAPTSGSLNRRGWARPPA